MKAVPRFRQILKEFLTPCRFVSRQEKGLNGGTAVPDPWLKGSKRRFSCPEHNAELRQNYGRFAAQCYVTILFPYMCKFQYLHIFFILSLCFCRFLQNINSCRSEEDIKVLTPMEAVYTDGGINGCLGKGSLQRHEGHYRKRKGMFPSSINHIPTPPFPWHNSIYRRPEKVYYQYAPFTNEVWH